MKNLFDKTKLSGIDMENRFVRAATWEAMADKKGYLTDELMKVYEDLAKGGVGLILTGYAFVIKDEQPNPGMMGIYDDSFIDDYKKITEMVHNNNSKIILQIAYGGSQTNYNIGTREIWGPSAVEHKFTRVTPKEMTKEEIDKLIKAFGDASLRAKKAGFDGVELHGAHGYLLSQFLNPYYNRRKDEYGGSIENRARIIFEIYEEVRNQVGKDYPVLIKINCSDFSDEGLTFEESKYVVKELSKKGIDAIEVSGGKPIRSKVHSADTESYFRTYAQEIAREVDVPVILVGGNKSLEVMEDILETTEIEYFSLSRPLLREPDLINRWKKGDRDKAKCVSCSKCFHPEGSVCIFNRK